MKRAIFKMGEDCTITSHASDGSYEVRYTKKWMNDENDWKVPFNKVEKARIRGTSIKVTEIKETVSQEFDSEKFEREFRQEVSTHFAYIIDKGFQIYVNKRPIISKSMQILFDSLDSASSEGIYPYIFQAEYGGVEVFLAVGFTRPIIDEDEAIEGQENHSERYSSEQSGWTIVCNDRTLLYCDKTNLTGWGISGVPRYHTQFISISGIVVFSSTDSSLLPTTTTKRGIDASSDLYMPGSTGF